MTDACSASTPALHDRIAPAIAASGTHISGAPRDTGPRGDGRADLVVIGAISTGDADSPTAEAMAIADGRIVGLGTRDDVEGLIGPGTRTLRPDGVVLPGLIEPHAHVWVSLLMLDWVDVSHPRCATFDDVVTTLKKAAGSGAPGEYLLAKLFDPSLYPGEPDLTRDILDRVALDRPVVVLNASMHFAYANSRALEAAGITDGTPAPTGGTFGRVDGRLTGVVGEAPAVSMLLAALPRPEAAEIDRGVRTILTGWASRGITSVREAMTGTIAGVSEIALLHRLNDTERLPVRVSTAQFSALPGFTTPREAAAAWRAAGVTPFSGDDMVRADAWKVVVDGSNQGRSGFFEDPYLGHDSSGRPGRGHANWTAEGLRDALSAGLDDGWQLMIHTNGDAAVDLALTTLEDLLAKDSRDLRHRLEHASVTTDAQLARMAAAGVSPSFLMDHVRYWGAAFRDSILGPYRAVRLDRLASALRAGLRPSIHSDDNVTTADPLRSAQTAVLRRLEADGSVLGPDERVTPGQALAAITMDAAWQIHADDRGVLRRGARADFVVADADPWSSDPERWHDIRIHETRIAGTPAFSA